MKLTSDISWRIETWVIWHDTMEPDPGTINMEQIFAKYDNWDEGIEAGQRLAAVDSLVKVRVEERTVPYAMSTNQHRSIETIRKVNL